MTAEEFAAALAGIDGSIASKGDFYNDMLGSGLSDAELRAMVDAQLGLQSDTDWNYLQQIAAAQDVSDGTVNDKINYYDSLQDTGLTDPEIRALVTNALGEQTDTDWNWLTSGDKALDVSTGTEADKAAYYNDLKSMGYSDADIRNITQDAVGPQTDSDWSYLVSLANGTEGTGSTEGTGGTSGTGTTANTLKPGTTSTTSLAKINLPGRTPATGENTNTGFNTYQPVKLERLGTFGASGNETLGAGSGDYQSQLIKNLRQADQPSLYSNNGFTLYGTTGGTGDSGFGVNSGGAFNPPVLQSKAATPQEMKDWDAYQAYRISAMQTKSPFISFDQWKSGQGNTSSQVANQEPDPYNYSGTVGGGS